MDPLTGSLPGAVPGDPEETVVLLGRARGGDRDAENELFLRYEERIRRIVRVRLGPGLRRWAESGDLVQETCRSALQGIGGLEVGSEFDFQDWLARVATQRIRDFADHVQAHKRDLARAEPLSDFDAGESSTDGSPADSGLGPGEEAFRAEVRAILDETVGSLPESYREVVVLRDYHGAGWTDIARVLGTPSVHAAQQLHQRAWLKVRLAAAPRLAGLRRD